MPSRTPNTPVDVVNKNFALPLELAEWLRRVAFEHRTSQAQLVREAVSDLRKKPKYLL